MRGQLLDTSVTRHCAGGKAPTEITSLSEALRNGSCERLNLCAGIAEPHLHVTCRNCGFERLMKTKHDVTH